jgi:hypothetical protein
MSQHGQEQHAELSWSQNDFHPQLKVKELPTIDDGWDAIVIAFALGALGGICLCVLIRYADSIKYFFGNF